MKKITMTTAAAFAALVLMMPVGSQAAQPDAWVTTKAKLSLLTSEGVGATAVNVDTVDGRVTLHGKVRTESEKKAAGDAVTKIEGVREVRNLLQVVPAKNEEKVEASDEQITKNVKDAFAKDPQIADSGINVQSVNKGVVLLAGETPSMTTHLRAVTAAAGISGVRRVATEVKGGEQLADVEPGQSSRGVMGQAKDRVAADSAKASDTMSDAYVTSKVKLRLLSNSETPALDINVDTDNGAVTLFGMVPSASAKAAAEAEARKVDGVRTVHNDLQVIAEKKQEQVAAQDGEIKAAVEKAIEGREATTGNDVAVEVKGGVVRLTGTVPNEDARVTAATTARAQRGVKAVLWEDLQIKKSNRS